MNFIQATIPDLELILKMIKSAALKLADKGINQWGYWQNPPIEKINWIRDGILKNEFFFVKNDENVIMGMFRLLFEDELYWGKQPLIAGYIHSLVIQKEFKGKKLGEYILKEVAQLLIDKNIYLLRLDCVSNNKRLCHYYENQGFKKVGEIQMPQSLNNLYEKKLFTI